MDAHTQTRLDRGVASSSTLQKLGITRTRLRRLMKDNTLRKIRRGWYATADAHPTVVAAVAAGGVLTCVDALRLHNVWVPPTGTTVHVRGTEDSQRGSSNFCRRHGRPPAATSAVDDLPTALQYAVRCLDHEGIVVVLDSILNKKLTNREELAAALRDCPRAIRDLLDKCDLAESGTESMVRLRLRARNITVSTQVTITGVGRVDLLVGNRLIIEVDGMEYHASRTQFERDRERDRIAVELGYVVIRLTYNQVVYQWEQAEASILTLIRRREHLRRTGVDPVVGTNPT
ncbi:DUF559 domain-containing protein [Gordonia jinghuaiqii]|uniref:DUF559 domain-containing protein n=1 Tax=Gordonia jinghuaiqii TaxID=2758710 RepID=A0A7D7QRI3_9ACTN|nr:DUF559 domain-containing protein [Gordonia jinghuaiqii]MCR5978518.1 DUF559 domain-containing protein [Gordonia jinghuaiqii]QMT02846.1 DUF559 domain-containing protein [Gordonia jinghuaiqii]